MTEITLLKVTLKDGRVGRLTLDARWVPFWIALIVLFVVCH